LNSDDGGTSVPVLELTKFDAFAFDLDGVVTKTAVVHAAAWRRTFDELLARLADGAPWTPFDVAHDYLTYVDGKPRRDGIRSFLASRGISLPEGTPADDPDASTVHGLAARKNRYFLAHLAANGVDVHPDATRLIHRVRAYGVATAVVTASENCDAILAAARLTELFAVRVDGKDRLRLGLRGKPAPDTFLEAARRLGVAPGRCVVLEDAIAGVGAGRAGRFGLVIGVDRVGQREALRRGGADLVVASLDELGLTRTGAERELR
jgi:beta-phosphoglucomutase family hydrolase